MHKKRNLRCKFLNVTSYDQEPPTEIKLVSSLPSPDFSGDLLKIHERGCISNNGCVNQTGSVLNVNYTITRYCCDTDLCNGATSTQLPLTAALSAALVAVWSQWDV